MNGRKLPSETEGLPPPRAKSRSCSASGNPESRNRSAANIGRPELFLTAQATSLEMKCWRHMLTGPQQHGQCSLEAKYADESHPAFAFEALGTRRLYPLLIELPTVFRRRDIKRIVKRTALLRRLSSAYPSLREAQLPTYRKAPRNPLWSPQIIRS